MIDLINENLTLVKGFNAQSKEEVEAFRIKYLGKKGILNDFFAVFKELPPQQKKDYGHALNTLKKAVADKVKALQVQNADTSPRDLVVIYPDLLLHLIWELGIHFH